MNNKLKKEAREISPEWISGVEELFKKADEEITLRVTYEGKKYMLIKLRNEK